MIFWSVPCSLSVPIQAKRESTKCQALARQTWGAIAEEKILDTVNEIIKA